MTAIKMTMAQFFKVKNDPIYYNLDFSYTEKDNSYECVCTPAQAKVLNKIISEVQ